MIFNWRLNRKVTFIVSNKFLTNSEKIRDIYIKGDYIRKDSHILIFKGFLFPENRIDKKTLLEQIVKNGVNFITKLKGNFCGIFIALEKNDIFFFTDRLRYFDLFYHFSEDLFIISDKFAEIIQTGLFSLNEIDKQALLEFVFFEYPLFGKTFIKNINFVSLGTIFKIDLDNKTLEKEHYYNLVFKPNPDFYTNNNYDELGKMFDRAIRRIKGLFPPETVYGLGLSGGLDSRLIAYLAKRHKLNLKTFIFGEKNSDAYSISRKIAKELNLDHHELGFKRDFFKYCEKGINYNPMMSLYYTWYYAIYKDLPQFDVYLTGFFGGGGIGGALLRETDLHINNDRDLAEQILKHYFEYDLGKNGLYYFRDKSLFSKIKKSIIEFSKNSLNSEFWQKIEEFNLKRQLTYTKNNPSFNFYGLYEFSYSIFVDPDIVTFFLKIPPKLRAKRNYYFNFFKEKIPSLFKIRRERDIPHVKPQFLMKILKLIQNIDTGFHIHLFFKKDHKRVIKWLSNYKKFSDYLKEWFLRENSFFTDLIYHNKIMRLISKNQWTESEMCLIFRFLTIKLFLDKMKDYSIQN